jgi:hypothetical protein
MHFIRHASPAAPSRARIRAAINRIGRAHAHASLRISVVFGPETPAAQALAARVAALDDSPMADVAQLASRVLGLAGAFGAICEELETEIEEASDLGPEFAAMAAECRLILQVEDVRREAA